jgi:hypothetical protein
LGTRQELGVFLLVLLLAVPPAVGWLCGQGAGSPPVTSLPLQQIRPLTGADCLLLGWPIPLNQAAALDLQLVPGIGQVLAERIIAVRGEQGGFRSFSDLSAVKGVGPRKLEALRLYLFVDPVKNPAPAP